MECCWDHLLGQYQRLTWPFWEAFIFSYHCLSCLFAKCEDWKTAHFQNEKFCFQGQILQKIKIRSWSNGVCCSQGISFRWHFWYVHFLSNNVIMKNKVLSYHGLNSRKSSTVADYLHFPSNKNTNTFFFSLLFWEFWWNLQFWKHITTTSKQITTDFVLSHHVRLKVVNSHTMLYFCGS